MNNKDPRKQKILRFTIHLIALCILFVLPEVMLSLNSHRPPHPMQWAFYLKALVFVGVFYAEYYLIFRRSPENRMRTWSFWIENALLLIAALALLSVIFWMLAGSGLHRVTIWPMLLRDTGIVVLTMALGFAMKFSEQLHMLQERQKEIDDNQRREELKQLKSQLNPHFLFNALNTIYALTDINAALARDAVHALSGLLRYVLYEADRPYVELRRELQFVSDYVRLMEMRMGTSVKIVTDIDAGGMADYHVAPMLFIVPLENAFKHGDTSSPGSEIIITVRTDETSSSVDYTVANTIRRDAAVLLGDMLGGRQAGVGLGNIRRRLELIYGNRAEFSVTNDGQRFITHMKISGLEKFH